MVIFNLYFNGGMKNNLNFCMDTIPKNFILDVVFDVEDILNSNYNRDIS